MHGFVVLWVLTPEASFGINEAVGSHKIANARVGNLEVEVLGFHGGEASDWVPLACNYTRSLTG
jgi:hypothetical protein